MDVSVSRNSSRYQSILKAVIAVSEVYIATIFTVGLLPLTYSESSGRVVNTVGVKVK